MPISGLDEYSYSLGSVYVLLGLWAAGQGARIHYYSKPATLQKAFHVVIFAVAAGSWVFSPFHIRFIRLGDVCAAPWAGMRISSPVLVSCTGFGVHARAFARDSACILDEIVIFCLIVGFRIACRCWWPCFQSLLPLIRAYW